MTTPAPARKSWQEQAQDDAVAMGNRVADTATAQHTPKSQTCLDCEVLPPFSIVLCPMHAAAPALLAALEGALIRLDFLHGIEHPKFQVGYIDNEHWRKPARAAIRAAKGESR